MGPSGPTGPAGVYTSIRTVTSTTTLTNTDQVVLCNAAANTILTLPAPAAGNTGHQIIVKRINTTASTCTVTGFWATEGTSLALVAPGTLGIGTDMNQIAVISNGTTWYTVNIH
jgi:hypothetical protein